MRGEPSRQIARGVTRRQAVALAASAAIVPAFAGRSVGADDAVGDLIDRTTVERRPPRGGFAPYTRAGDGPVVLPDLSFEYAQANAGRARGWLTEVAQLRRRARTDDEIDTLD